MENITKLANSEKLVVAGPFKKNDKVHKAEILEWCGSAALPMYLPFHN